MDGRVASVDSQVRRVEPTSTVTLCTSRLIRFWDSPAFDSGMSVLRDLKAAPMKSTTQGRQRRRLDSYSAPHALVVFDAQIAGSGAGPGASVGCSGHHSLGVLWRAGQEDTAARGVCVAATYHRCS